MRLAWLDERLYLGPVRQAVEARAADLLAADAGAAYAVARAEARRYGSRGLHGRFWRRIALAVARREGREIGVTGADRYPTSTYRN